MLNSLNKTHLDQKLHFKSQLDNVSDDWADVSYRYDECASISNGICTVYFGTADIDGSHPYICACIEDDGTHDLGSFNTIKAAIEFCDKNQGE
tara:strand:- start:205 stop:483 length:279 start_codon:yes stop_codon:yes gene_type:complete